MKRREFLAKAATVSLLAVVQPWKVLELVGSLSPSRVQRQLSEWEQDEQAEAAAYITTAATLAEMVAAGIAYGSIKDFGCRADGIADDSTPLANFFAFQGATGRPSKQMILESGTYYYTVPPIPPTGGINVRGVGSGKSFTSILQPYNCAAFDLTINLTGMLLQDVMIWPIGTVNPAFFLRLDGTGNMTFKNVYIYMQTGSYTCTTAAVWMRNTSLRNLGTIFENFLIRTDGAANYPVGFLFDNNCGQATVRNMDIETCNTGISHLGGNITLMGGYAERMDCLFDFNPNSDANASFSILGGYFNASGSGWPIKIHAGCKNTSIRGSYIGNSGVAQQLAAYSFTNASGIVMDIENGNDAWWADGGAGPIDPALFQVRHNPVIAQETVTYSASMTPTVPLGTMERTSVITATNNTAFTINAPTNASSFACVKGSRLTIRLHNTSGGALGALTLNASYKIGSAFPTPANGKNQSVTFEYNATNWIEVSRTAADVSN